MAAELSKSDDDCIKAGVMIHPSLVVVEDIKGTVVFYLLYSFILLFLIQLFIDRSLESLQKLKPRSQFLEPKLIIFLHLNSSMSLMISCLPNLRSIALLKYFQASSMVGLLDMMWMTKQVWRELKKLINTWSTGLWNMLNENLQMITIYIIVL